MTLSDYQGKVFDLMAFQGARNRGDIRLTQKLFSEEYPGMIGTGVQKLAQRWLITFMTELGSMTFQPDLGTDFLREARYGFRSETDVYTAFELARLQAAQQLQNEEDDTWNDEDRYSSAVLEAVILLPTYMNLKVRITSLAGNSRQVILPVSILPISTRK